MTKLHKKRVISDRNVKSTKSAVKKAVRKLSYAQLEAQNAQCESQLIAAQEYARQLQSQVALLQRDAGGDRPPAFSFPSQAAGFPPQGGSFAPIRKSFVPQGDGFVPIRKSFAPQGDGFAPIRKSFAPQADGYVPQGNGFAPTAYRFAPQGDGFVPQGDGFVPQGNGFVPQGNGFVPQPGGFPPQGDGYAPQPGGFAPIRKSFVPQGDGFSPQPGGFVPQPGGFVPQPGGFVPQPGGFSPQGDGLPPTAYRFAPQADGRFEKGSPRITFPVPVITNAFASGPHAITVHWLSVPGADGYSLRFATDPELTQYVSSTVAATLTGLTRTGLEPGTKYYVMIRANAASPDSASNYSVPIEVTTPAESQPGVAGDLYAWWNAMETATAQFTSSIPAWGPVVLSPAERRRLKGSGVRRYGFIDKVSDVSADWPQFWPSSANGLVDFQSAMKERLRELEVLRNLLVWIDMIRRNVGDLLLLAGDDAFKMAGVYYSTVRAAARNHLNGAPQVFKLLQLFWNHRRKATDDVTIAQAEHDAKALLHGNEEGSLTIVNQGRHTTGGKTFIADETRNVKQHNGTKVVERETTG